jgi:hypothetical protein
MQTHRRRPEPEPWMPELQRILYMYLLKIPFFLPLSFCLYLLI